MKLNKAVFLIFFLPFHSYGASFDCSKASTEIEKTICDNEWLGSLDEELSFFYNKLHESSSQEESLNLLREQRKWIQERNKVCETSYNKTSCLSDMYRKRVNALKISYEKPLLPSKESLEKICGDIAVLDSSGRREYGDIKETFDADRGIKLYDINNDGVKEIAESCLGGTMHVPCVEFKLPNGEPLRIKTINYEWKDYWTYGLKTFNKNGEWFRLHSYDDNLVKPAYVSYMTPENNEYVVCEFENIESEKFIPTNESKANADICNLAKENKLQYVELKDKPLMTREQVRESGRYETGIQRQGYLDIDNDGNKELIAQVEYASGAGRGCDFLYYDELIIESGAFKNDKGQTPLLNMQGINSVSGHPNCGGMNNRLFEFSGKIYYEINTSKEHRISVLHSNEALDVCIVKKSIETNVKYIGPPNKL